MEVHHIVHKSDGGGNKIENAIPLCFECHAEANHYNPDHPKGRKFTDEELLGHKKQWLDTCAKHPEALIAAPRDADIGPLEGMSLELEFNQSIISRISDGAAVWQENIGSTLHEQEYFRAVKEGSLLLLPEDLRKLVNDAYSVVGRVNTFIRMYSSTPPEGNAFSEATNRLLNAYRKGWDQTNTAVVELKKFLSPEGGENDG